MSFRRGRLASLASARCCAVALAAVLLAPAGVAGATVDPANVAAAAKAVDWLMSQQQSDGGFELAGSPGFETPDAVAAIAADAQTGPAWSTDEARAAVSALHYGGPGGKTPLDALDTWAHTAITPGQAAKLVVLVVAPLGLNASAFGSGPKVDLAATIDPAKCAGDPATYGFFNGTLYAALAKKLLCGAPNPAALATIRNGQRADGGWNYLGDTDPASADSDIDTTALAIEALVAGGASSGDAAIVGGLAFLAAQQSGTGAFQSFGSDDANSTAVAMLAIAAAGYDPATACWRDTADPARAGTAYVDPDAWLRSQQQSDGRVASANDGYGINTFATSQTVEAWLRSWLPVARASGAATCTAAATVTTTTTAVAADPVVSDPTFTG